MRWVHYLDEECMVMQDDDLLIAKPLIEKATEMWKNIYLDTGPVVYACGIAVLYLAKRCRKPIKHIIIPSPGQGSGVASVEIPMSFLHRHGISCFFEYGSMD